MIYLRTSACVVLVAALWYGGSQLVQNPIEERLDVPVGPDPTPREDARLLDEALSQPTVVKDAKGVVLLVHGTGMTPQINWDSTLLQPLTKEGYQPFYLEVPKRMFLDIQKNAEYISHSVKKLAQEHEAASAGVSVISWSAGSLAVQWTLTFYPETRAHVKQHIALGPSYRGSWMMLPLYYLNLYSEAVVQQLPWSKCLAALRRFGGEKAQVPTTSIGSSTDMIVQPGFYGEGWESRGYKDAWRLEGPLARNIDLFKVCRAKTTWRQRWFPRIFSHDSLLWEPASHKVIFDALRNEETYLGTANVITDSDCLGGLAPHMDADAEEKHAAILPELFKYAPTQPTQGWPEVPLRAYAM